MRSWLVVEDLGNGRERVTLRDPRELEGEILWPGHIPEATVLELEQDLGDFAPAQLQQAPVPSTGGTFQKQWLQNYWLPNIPLPTFTTVIQSWDMRFKDSKSSGDWVVGQVWGMHRALFYLLDQVRGRWSFVETCDQMRSLTIKWPKAHTKLVEDKANGPAVCSQLQKDIPGIELIDPEGGKEARAWGVSGYYRSGNVLLPLPSAAPWVAGALDSFETEHVRFPKGAHDDQVDAASQALTWLSLRVPKLLQAMQAIADEQEAAKKK